MKGRPIWRDGTERPYDEALDGDAEIAPREEPAPGIWDNDEVNAGRTAFGAGALDADVDAAVAVARARPTSFGA